jgi:hypothetical protein
MMWAGDLFRKKSLRRKCSGSARRSFSPITKSPQSWISATRPSFATSASRTADPRSLTRLKADWRAYDMDVYNANVTLYAGQGNRIRLGLDDIHRMINELTYVEEVITKFQNERKTKNAI